MNAYSAIQYGMASQLVKSGLRIDNHAEISELDTQSLYSQIPGKRQAIKDSIHAFRVHLWFSLISCITHITDRYQDCAWVQMKESILNVYWRVRTCLLFIMYIVDFNIIIVMIFEEWGHGFIWSNLILPFNGVGGGNSVYNFTQLHSKFHFGE